MAAEQTQMPERDAPQSSSEGADQVCLALYLGSISMAGNDMRTATMYTRSVLHSQAA